MGHNVAIGILLLWLVLYWGADPTTRWRSFFGNAAADWLGAFVIVVATKFCYERGSVESRPPPVIRDHTPPSFHDHSLTVLLW